MSNFFPLIIDASGNVGTIQELPTADNLDFTGSGIVNLATGNLQLTGGSSGQYLSTDGSGGLSWSTVTVSTDQISNGSSNVSIPSADGNIEFYINGTLVGNMVNSGSPFQGFNSEYHGHGNSGMLVNENAGIYFYASGQSNKLVIDTTGVQINGTYYLPTNNGTNGQVLTTNGSGTATWNDPNLPSDPSVTTITIDNILLENDGSNVLSVTNTSMVTGNVSVATATAYGVLYNFNYNTIQNDNGNVAVAGSSTTNATLSTGQLKYNNYSWYNIVASNGFDWFIGNYDFAPYASANNWTIDMWIYADSGGDGASNQFFLVNNDGSISLRLTGSLPTSGDVVLNIGGSSGGGGTDYTIGTMSGSGWYHVGITRVAGVLYGLFNGTITAISGNPATSFSNNIGIGGFPGYSYSFGIGYIADVRASLYALFDPSGSYSLPISSDYDITGNVNTWQTYSSTKNAAPPAWSVITNSSGNLATITGTVGSVVAVTDGGGKLAYWDTSNSRWSYVFDNSAV